MVDFDHSIAAAAASVAVVVDIRTAAAIALLRIAWVHCTRSVDDGDQLGESNTIRDVQLFSPRL